MWQTLSADEFLDRVYLSMVRRLPYPNKENPHPREDFDRSLEVSAWHTPLSKRYSENVPDGAPQWWHGDEAATDEFLKGMGVQSLDQLRR